MATPETGSRREVRNTVTAVTTISFCLVMVSGTL